MAPSNPRRQFNLENIKEEDNDNDNQRDCDKQILVKRPAFQKSRFEITSNNNNKQNEPSTIKEQFRPDLKQLSLPELKNLLIKQERIVRNRFVLHFLFCFLFMFSLMM